MEELLQSSKILQSYMLYAVIKKVTMIFLIIELKGDF